MSSSITIPAAKKTSCAEMSRRQAEKAAASSSSSYSNSPRTPEASKAAAAAQPSRIAEHNRRPSLLSSAISQQQCTTINLNEDDPDGPPRLISYLSSSQGFAWNPEIFIPPHCDYEYVPLENRRDPVHDIILSDEEIKKMMPQ